MSSVTFETAAIADVIKKAAKIAPSKGAAFDKAAGIVIEFNPASPIPLAVVRATNLDIFMMEWVTVTEWEGEGQRWRLPSSLLAMVMGSLPIGTDKTVTLESTTDGVKWNILLKSGRTRAKFQPIDLSYYPTWGAFDPDEMYPANDLGGRISQVSWAASKNDPKLAGVYLNGTHAIATDTFRMARVPLEIPSLEHPIIVPSEVLGQILRETGEIQIGKSKDDNTLRVMPDDTTQIKTTLYDTEYPPVERVMSRELTHKLKIDRDLFMETMSRINNFGSDRVAAFQLYIGAEEIALYLENGEVGSIGDAVELPGECVHPDRYLWYITPKNIMDAVSKSPNKGIELHYNPNEPKYPLKIDDGAGYEAWVMPRSRPKPEEQVDA